MSKNGKPSLLMWHELAHLVSKSGHTDKWAKAMRELCGRVYLDPRKWRKKRHPKFASAEANPSGL